MLPFLSSSGAGAAAGGMGAMDALTPAMASQLPSWLNPADVAGVMPLAGSSGGGIGSIFGSGGGSSDSIGKLLKLLGPTLGGGQQKPSPPSMPGIPPIGIMQSKPFQPINGQPINTQTGVNGSNNQVQQALMQLIMQANGGI
jgi:hypothetical protein